MKSDIEIAREAELKPIFEIAEGLGIEAGHVYAYGPHKAKISLDAIAALKDRPEGKLILVTGITPTPAGEGKTTTTVGLGDALNRIGKKASICLRDRTEQAGLASRKSWSARVIDAIAAATSTRAGHTCSSCRPRVERPGS